MCVSLSAPMMRFQWELIYEIDPHKCTECVGHFDEPQCMQVCPVSCIPVNPDFMESREVLLKNMSCSRRRNKGFRYK